MGFAQRTGFERIKITRIIIGETKIIQIIFLVSFNFCEKNQIKSGIIPNKILNLVESAKPKNKADIKSQENLFFFTPQ